MHNILSVYPLICVSLHLIALVIHHQCIKTDKCMCLHCLITHLNVAKSVIISACMEIQIR